MVTHLHTIIIVVGLKYPIITVAMIMICTEIFSLPKPLLLFYSCLIMSRKSQRIKCSPHFLKSVLISSCDICDDIS